jgi:HEAT repeat protein
MQPGIPAPLHCPICGRNLEAGQTVCACGAPIGEADSEKGGMLGVVLVGLTVLALLGGIVAIVVVVGMRLSKQIASRPHAPPPPVVVTTLPAPVTTPPAPTTFPAVRRPVAPRDSRRLRAAMTRPAPPALPAPPRSAQLTETDRLIANLKSPNRHTRELAASDLEDSGWQPADNNEKALVLVATGNPVAAEPYGDAAVEPICVAIQDPAGDSDLIVSAAGCLGRLLDARAVGPLTKLLAASKDASVRAGAATALGRIRDRASIPALKQAKADETDAEAKSRIAAALNQFDDPEPNPLVAALKDDDARVQVRAAMLLGRRHDPRALGWMDATINGDNLQLREEAIAMLRKDGGIDAIKILVHRVGGKGFDGPNDALAALVDIGRPAIGPMVAALPSMNANARWMMLQGLARLGEPAMIALTDSLATAAKDLKETICESLGRVGDREDIKHKPVEPLIALLKDDDATIRQSAAHALDLIKWTPATAEEREVLEKAKAK